ncbi:TerB N-terminal domain-containing protein [Paenibacillus sp. CMAA1364]
MPTTYHEAELVLEGYTKVSRGVGQAFAIPVLTINATRLSAAEVSRCIKPDQPLVPVLDGYVSVNTLREAGLGPMGRTIQGALLDRPYQLTPSEIIARGSDRLQGAWSAIVFPDLQWPYMGDSPIYDHLNFLRTWGLNGGIRGGALPHAQELQSFMNDIMYEYPETQILVVGKKALLDKLRESWAELDTMWLTVSGKDQIKQQIGTNGVIISTPSVAKQHQLEKISFDIIIMLEPDDLTKSSTTQIFKQLKKMKSRLKLAVYSEADYIAQSYVSTAHMNLLKINDYTLAKYVIYNPNQVRKELPRAYRRMVSHPMVVQQQESTPLHMTEMQLESDHLEKGTPIPRREMAEVIRNEVPRQVPVLHRMEHFFTTRARLLEDKIDSSATHIPYFHYWPTYDSMTSSQSRWYFYWRGEVRGQRYPDTSLSYVFLYVYELINGIGWKNGMEGYHLMLDVWVAYRERHPKLTSYMIEWITDFVLVHQLSVPHEDVLGYAPHGLSGDLLELELMYRFHAETLDIPFTLLVRLLDVDVRKSKFYLEGGDALLHEYAPKVLALVDAYFSKQQGLRFIEIFSPGSPVSKERELFQSATYDESLYGRFTTIFVSKISEHVPLREYITHLIRLTENKLREHMNVKGKLRGIELEPEIEMLVSRYLERMLKSPSPEAQRPSVVIDEVKLARIQEDSESVRDMLTVNIDEADATEDIVVFVAPFIEEPVVAQSPITWDTTELPEEWMQFVKGLSQTQLEAIYVLKQGLGLIELGHIADQAGTMPELLLDDINEIAMDTIGDLIIEGDGLIEDYEPMLANLMKAT